jgi:predicted dehydrogenase
MDKPRLPAFHCRWAFLGLSSIAELFYRDLTLPRDEEKQVQHELVAVSTTRSTEAAVSWLAEQQVSNASAVRIYTSYTDMLREGNFDVVYISTPHGVHFEHARAALMHGRNVLLEKPATMNEAQYARLAEIAKSNQLVLMEAMWTRYFPLTRYLQDELLPRIGPVKRIMADYSLPLFGDPTLTHFSRFLDKKTGSGSLLDLGVYPLTWCDLALPSADGKEGEDEQLLTVKYAETIQHETGVDEPLDDITTVILSRAGSSATTCVVTISSSIPGSAKLGLKEKLLRQKNAPSVRIQGEVGEIALPFPPIRPETLTVQYYGQDRLDENGFETTEVITKSVVGWGLGYQADVFASVIRDRGSHPSDGVVIGENGSLRVLQWVDQAKLLAGIKYKAELERVW